MQPKVDATVNFVLIGIGSREWTGAELISQPDPISPASDLARLDPAQLADELVSGRRNPRGLSVHEEFELRRWCRSRARASADTIQRLHDLRHYDNARRARDEHLGRRVVQLDALFTASRKRWRTKQCMPAARREAVRLQRLQYVFEQIGQVGKLTRSARAQQFLVPKDNGQGFRLVTSFDCVDRARQIMLRSALKPFANLHDAQFLLARDRNRRGPAAVREALLAALQQCSGDHVFLHFDVENYYGSISQTWLERHLGIDPKVVKRQIHSGEMTFTASRATAFHRDRHHAGHVASRESDRWDIPQGSALSCLIAEQVMATVIRSAAVFEEWPLFVWSDNLGMLAPRDRAGEIVRRVRDAFTQSGAGRFHLGQVTTHDVTREFKFLGVWYRLSDGVAAHAFIPQAVANAWALKVMGRILIATSADLNAIAQHVAGKREVWRWWSGWPRIEASLNRSLAAANSCPLVLGTPNGPASGQQAQ